MTKMKMTVGKAAWVAMLVFMSWSRPAAAVEGCEKPYDFRAKLQVVHQPNRRDWTLQRTKGEFEFTPGMRLVVVGKATPLLLHAAEDFRDYLATSMGVSASVSTPGQIARERQDGRTQRKETLEMTLAGEGNAYTVEVTADKVRVVAPTDKLLAQALYHLEDRMNLRRAPLLKAGKERREPLFSPRMTHSGWGCDQFPDAHLGQIAHYGMDAILIFIRDIDYAKTERCLDIRDTIRRAKAWGLDTYLYSHVKAFKHPSEPDAPQYFANSFGRVAKAYPEAKGIVLVGESCEFPSKDERAIPLSYRQKKEVEAYRRKHGRKPLAGWFPCRDYPEWLRAVKRAIEAEAPKMEIVFWSYNWGRQDKTARLELIRALPPDVTLQATFEMFESTTLRSGLKSTVADYSLAFIGPGRYFTSESQLAKELGRRMYSMTNTGGHTWDFGTIPFDPFPYQWRKRFEAVVRAHDGMKLDGLMEDHHFGWWPSFISEISKEMYTRGGMPFDELLPAIAARDYGAENVPEVLGIWREWSEHIGDMHAVNENQYGPFRIGPAYPYGAMEEVKNSDLYLGPMYLAPNFRQYAGKDADIRLELQMLEPMSKAFLEGGAKFMRMADALTDRTQADNARQLGRMGLYMGRTCLTAINVKNGLMAERAKDRAAVERYAKAEYANARAALPLVRQDSRLGWEPTMLYRGGPEAIEWKLRFMEKHYQVGK